MPVAYSQPVIATSSAATYNQSQDWDLQFLKLENARAARLLKVVGQLDSKTALDYLARLRALFDGLPTGNLEIGHCAAIARTFLDARVALETAVPTVREWAVVARAVDPTLVDKPLRVPSRFVRRAQETEEAPLVFSASAAAVARAIRMTLEPADADSRPA